jgi:16S rRNA (guanine527-N7)-methyltransferase
LIILFDRKKGDWASMQGVPAERRPPIATWLSLLREWNARIDLTAARTDDELEDLMLADALVLAEEANVPHGARVIDIGTGAGAPGLALALLRPDLAVTLVEPLAKRVAFLRTVLGTIGRTDIVLVRDRAESVAKKNPARWDVAVSRATLAPESWLPLGLSLAPKVWVLLAREPAPPGTIEKEIAYEWPLTGASRRAVLYART